MEIEVQKSRIGLSGYLALVLLAGLVFLLSWHTLTSIYQDIGRHLTFGRIIWETGDIPRTNTVSFTNPEFPFINHHWLGEVMLYLGERTVGLSGLIAAKAILLTASFLLAFLAAWRRRILMPSLAVGLVSIFVMAERTDVRPEIFSFLFLAWFLFVLYRADEMSKYECRMSKFGIRYSTLALLTLPVIQLLWVNTHIYFFMGIFVWFAFLIGRVSAYPNITSGLRSLFATRYWLVTLGVVLATLANPWFVKGALYPFTILGNYGYSIVENKSYFFLRAFGYPSFTFSALVVGAVLVAVSFILNRRNIRGNVMGILIAAGTLVLSLMMVRNYPLFGLVILPVIFKNLRESGIRWPVRGTALGAVVLFLLCVSTVQGQLFRRLGPGGRAFGLEVPQGHQRAVDFFRDNGLKGPLFNNFDVGSYLIWRLPEEPVFIDGRPEAYPARFIQEVYIRAQERPDVWEQVAGEYGINAVFWNVRDITPWSQTFIARMRQDPGWPLVYADGTIEIFLKDSPENRALIGRLTQVQ